MKVDVYYNLHKNRLSVKSREPLSYGKVINHVDTILLYDCTFVVQKAGRKRVLKEKRKNVHAFVRGNICSKDMIIKYTDSCRTVRYNPYLYDSFVYEDSEEPVKKADLVAIVGKKIIAYNPM
jgi:hypothetical protein